MKAAAVIVAGGSGKRFGSRTPKQFLLLNGLPVFLWSVLAFKAVRPFAQVIVVVPPARMKRLAGLARRHGFELAAGGRERFDSVRSGLSLVRGDIDHIAIHDGARPLVTPRIIRAGLAAGRENGASVVAVPARDTVKTAHRETGFVGATVPRTGVWLAQTPQTFHRSVVTAAYERLDGADVTDDAQAAERLGYPVKLVPGDYSNIKITEKKDLALAGFLMTAAGA